MKNLYFDDFEDLVSSVADTYDSLKGEDYEDVAIIAKYEEARQIIKELLCIGYDIHSINIIDEEYGEYDAEYIISIYDDEIWCEQMLRENGYITDDSPVMYILDNCSSKVIHYSKGKNVFEVSIGVDGCDCDECECACKKDEKPTTTSKESYFINGKSVDKSEFDKKYEEFEEMYLDNIRDMLLNYCEFMDEMNDWRSRLLRWSLNNLMKGLAAFAVGSFLFGEKRIYKCND